MALTAAMERQAPPFGLKVGLSEMLKGGVIMDVMSVDQARLAEKAGAVAVMALDKVPAMIRATGGIARMAKAALIKEICSSVSIPVMAKARIGHWVEAQVLQEMGVDFIDESEVLTPADYEHHIDKNTFKTPFVCGARNLGEALRRISEGAAMIRTKGEAGTGDISHAIKHLRTINNEIRALAACGSSPEQKTLNGADRSADLYAEAKRLGAPLALVAEVARTGKLPVPNFSAGGIATPADAALVRQLGAEAIFVGSGIFMADALTPLDVSLDPVTQQPVSPQDYESAFARAKSIVMACTYFDDTAVLLEASEMATSAMKGVDLSKQTDEPLLQVRGN